MNILKDIKKRIEQQKKLSPLIMTDPIPCVADTVLSEAEILQELEHANLHENDIIQFNAIEGQLDEKSNIIQIDDCCTERRMNMANLFDHLENILYKKTVGREELHVEYFTIFNAWKFFISTCEKYPQEAQKCLTEVKHVGTHYQVSQLILTIRNEPLYIKDDFVAGRIVRADRISEGIRQLLKDDRDIVVYLDKNTLFQVEYSTSY